MPFWVGQARTPGNIVNLKPGIVESEWLALKKSQGKLVKKVKIPGLRTMMAWNADGIAKSISGKKVEPDGYDPEGYPSWLLAMGYI